MIDAAHDGGRRAIARIVQDLDRDDPGRRRDADDADPVVGDTGRGAGDVRSVPVPIFGRSGAHAVLSTRGVDIGSEIGMIQVDAGIEDGDRNAGAAEPRVTQRTYDLLATANQDAAE